MGRERGEDRKQQKRASRQKPENPLILLVPEVGIEPTWACTRGILSPIF